MKVTAIAGLLGVALFAGGVGALQAEDQKHQGSHGRTHETHATGGKGSKMLHEHMRKASADMKDMKMTGDVDHDFVMAMRQHHQHGIEMAQVVLREGRDPEAKQFAQKVLAEQQKDIAEFDRWLQQHTPKTAGKPATTK